MQHFFLTSEDTYYAPLLEYTNKCKVSDGLYNQFPFETDGIDQFTSPDQLIAFVACFASDNRQQAIDNIWSYLVKHLFTYDNTTGKTNFNRTMQPSCVLFCGIHAGHKWLSPLLSIMLIISCFTKKTETSGKLKAWVMFKSLNMKITEKICDYFINKNTYLKSWPGVFKEYFKEEGHPIPEAAEKYYL